MGCYQFTRSEAEARGLTGGYKTQAECGTCDCLNCPFPGMPGGPCAGCSVPNEVHQPGRCCPLGGFEVSANSCGNNSETNVPFGNIGNYNLVVTKNGDPFLDNTPNSQSGPMLVFPWEWTFNIPCPPEAFAMQFDIRSQKDYYSRNLSSYNVRIEIDNQIVYEGGEVWYRGICKPPGVTNIKLTITDAKFYYGDANTQQPCRRGSYNSLWGWRLVCWTYGYGACNSVLKFNQLCNPPCIRLNHAEVINPSPGCTPIKYAAQNITVPDGYNWVRISYGPTQFGVSDVLLIDGQPVAGRSTEGCGWDRYCPRNFVSPYIFQKAGGSSFEIAAGGMCGPVAGYQVDVCFATAPDKFRPTPQ